MQLKPLFPNAPDEQSTREYRVVQWATGESGARTLRAAVEHPRLDVVGVLRATAPPKSGRDAGEGRRRRRRRARHHRSGRRTRAEAGLRAVRTARAGPGRRGARCSRRGSTSSPTRTDLPLPGRRWRESRSRRKCRGGLRRGRRQHPQHRQQPRLRHGGAAVRPRVAATAPRTGCSSRSSPTCRGAIPPGCSSRSWGSAAVRERLTEQRLASLRASFGPSLRLVADTLGLPVEQAEVQGEFAERTGAHLDRRRGFWRRARVAAQRITVAWLTRGKPVLPVPGHLVLHHRPRPGSGPEGHGLAPDGRRRRPARRDHPFSRGRRGRARRLPVLHRQPRGQCGAVGVRGAAGHTDHGGSAADRAGAGMRSRFL